MSLFWSQWMGQFWNQDVVTWLRDDWHCNLIRAAMGVEAGGYLEDPEAQKQRMIDVVEAAIAVGIYVIIDWHEENADQHADDAKAFFSEMAQRYGSYPNVLFETFNEPVSQSWSGQIKPYHEQVVAEIRKYSSNLVVLGTGMYSQNVDEAAGDPVVADNIAYTLHFYAATHGQELRDKAQSALSKGAALFVTEWGASSADGDGELDFDAARAWMQFLEDNGISCANWSICDKDEKSAALRPGASGSGGWAEGEVSESGAFVRDLLRGYWSPQEEAVVLK
jgi:endoglucanase